MTIDDKTRDGKLQYDNTREAAKNICFDEFHLVNVQMYYLLLLMQVLFVIVEIFV